MYCLHFFDIIFLSLGRGTGYAGVGVDVVTKAVMAV